MKKILSVLVALLLIVSIPASAATKKAVKEKYKAKSIKVSITGTNNNGTYTLFARTNKQGLSAKENKGLYIMEENWLLSYKDSNNKVQNIHLTNSSFSRIANNKKPSITKATISNTVSKLVITPTPGYDYAVTYSIRLRAGNSKTVFAGSKTINLKNIPNENATTQQTYSTYKFIINEPNNSYPLISAGCDIAIPVTLKVDKVNQLGYSNTGLKVSYSSNPSGILTLSGFTFNQLNTGYWSTNIGPIPAKDYSLSNTFKANFSTAGTYVINFSLINLLDNTTIVSKSITVNVGSQTVAVKDLAIGDLTILPVENSNNIYKLYVTKLYVVYDKTTSVVTLNDKYYVGDIKPGDLDTAGYQKSFYVTYDNFTKYFTLTGAEIKAFIF